MKKLFLDLVWFFTLPYRLVWNILFYFHRPSPRPFGLKWLDDKRAKYPPWYV